MLLSIYFLLFLVGVIVGFINIISAGGSLISLPLLIFLGLPPNLANGTNRIAIMIQNITALIEFFKKGLLNWKLSLVLSVPAIVGSFIGAELAIDLSETTFNNTVAIIIIIVSILIFLKPYENIKNINWKFHYIKNIALFISFFIVGFYGGFIQAGVGFLIIAFLSIFKRHLYLVEMHSIKTFVITNYLFLSTIIFLIHGHINWGYAIFLSAGSGIGGWLGSRFTITVSEKVLQTTMTILIFSFAVILLLTRN